MFWTCVKELAAQFLLFLSLIIETVIVVAGDGNKELIQIEVASNGKWDR